MTDRDDLLRLAEAISLPKRRPGQLNPDDFADREQLEKAKGPSVAEAAAEEKCKCGHPENSHAHLKDWCGECLDCPKFEPSQPSAKATEVPENACPTCGMPKGDAFHWGYCEGRSEKAQPEAKVEGFEEWWANYLSGRSINPFPEEWALWNAKQAAWSAWNAAIATMKGQE